jgi:oligopeptide/dipeptide ABC transporter ATP-binding protein
MPEETTLSRELLQVRGLTTAFPARGRKGPAGQLLAVDAIDFEIARGETLGLVGESGCGKSMTALSLIRLVPPPGRITSGSAIFEGRDLLRLSEPDMRKVRGARIGFVFQEPMTALNPVFTIGEQVSEALFVHGMASKSEARARAVALLDAVRIPDPARRARDYPHQLSGGMRQRALVAAAVACRPALVIADEPTTALDVTIQAEILDLLREMRDEFGLAMLLITHDLGVVAEMTDRVAVMYAGRIVESGPVGDVLRSPMHPYTRGLLDSLPGRVPGERLKAIGGTVPVLSDLPAGCAFAPRCPSRFERCDTARPDAVMVGSAHSARCFLHGPAS